jgi:hypothetical protein
MDAVSFFGAMILIFMVIICIATLIDVAVFYGKQQPKPRPAPGSNQRTRPPVQTPTVNSDLVILGLSTKPGTKRELTVALRESRKKLFRNFNCRDTDPRYQRAFQDLTAAYQRLSRNVY